MFFSWYTQSCPQCSKGGACFGRTTTSTTETSPSALFDCTSRLLDPQISGGFSPYIGWGPPVMWTVVYVGLKNHNKTPMKIPVRFISVISTINHRIQPLTRQLNAFDWGPHPTMVSLVFSMREKFILTQNWKPILNIILYVVLNYIKHVIHVTICY